MPGHTEGMALKSGKLLRSTKYSQELEPGQSENTNQTCSSNQQARLARLKKYKAPKAAQGVTRHGHAVACLRLIGSTLRCVVLYSGLRLCWSCAATTLKHDGLRLLTPLLAHSPEPR